MSRTRRRGPWVVRIVRARPRLFTSVAISIVVAVALIEVTDWRPATCMLFGWDIGVALYLLLASHVMAVSSVQAIRKHAAQQDEGQITILVLTVSAALASVGAIFAELGAGAEASGGPQLTRVILAATTILLSWAFIHTIFALHYAHEFYDDDPGGMTFPGHEGDPDYWDFLYFSLVIGMTSQVSDVAVTTKRIRRTVSAHGVISFVFNAALLALTVNLAASQI
jgi:uncharacterized membrane protein